MTKTLVRSSDAPPRNTRVLVDALVAVLIVIATCGPASAQICKPISQRAGQEAGCWITVDAAVGQLPRAPVFWHLGVYPTRAAAEAARGPRGIVEESFGKVWLFTIDVAGWRPSGGEHVAEIGPLPTNAGARYSAQYMEAVFTPGMTAPAHRHSGPEARYTPKGLCKSK